MKTKGNTVVKHHLFSRLAASSAAIMAGVVFFTFSSVTTANAATVSTVAAAASSTDISSFLPGGPDFAPFAGLSFAVVLVFGIIDAVIVVLAIWHMLTSGLLTVARSGSDLGMQASGWRTFRVSGIVAIIGIALFPLIGLFLPIIEQLIKQFTHTS